MKHESAGWKATTHEWADSPDVDHLEQIHRQPGVFAPSGLMHLVLEVLAYAADEAVSNDFGRGVVTLHRDGSVAIADNGRGTDTRVDHRGRKVKKPVMATRDYVLRLSKCSDPCRRAPKTRNFGRRGA